MQNWENIERKYDHFIKFPKSMTIVWPIQKYDLVWPVRALTYPETFLRKRFSESISDFNSESANADEDTPLDPSSLAVRLKFL